MLPRLLVLLIALSTACGTKANPDFCCIGTEDCAQVGVSEDLPCADGLTCVNNDCVRTSCETEGCPAEQPVCNVVSGACEGCSDKSGSEKSQHAVLLPGWRVAPAVADRGPLRSGQGDFHHPALLSDRLAVRGATRAAAASRSAP
jgi:hypothetical protein